MQPGSESLIHLAVSSRWLTSQRVHTARKSPVRANPEKLPPFRRDVFPVSDSRAQMAGAFRLVTAKPRDYRGWGWGEEEGEEGGTFSGGSHKTRQSRRSVTAFKGPLQKRNLV